MKKKLLARALRYLAFVNVVVTILCASAAQAASHRPGSTAGEYFGTHKSSNSTVNAPVKVTGKVTDEKGLPLIGVNIAEQGARNNSVTDNKGAYTITVSSENAVLVFSYIGFNTK